MLYGGSGNDNLYGGTGNDVLQGGSGNDWVRGNEGVDQNHGNAGADRFLFDDGETGVGLGNRDVIHDFARVEGDKIDVDWIDANSGLAGDQDFAFVYANEFSAVGQLRYVNYAGYTVIEGNSGGSLAADFQIQLSGWTAPMVAGDFAGVFVPPPGFDPDFPAGF